MTDYEAKYRQYTNEELEAAISQLSSEASYNPHVQEELEGARAIAEERGLFV